MTSYSEPTAPIGSVIELFAGVGGFRIGLGRQGWKTTFSNQWEPSTKAQHASDVYVANFGDAGHHNVDIADLVGTLDTSEDNIPNSTMLVGGFPCQDYSVAKTLGAASGLHGKKGVLWWEILKIVSAKRPPIIFLENVDRLLKSPSAQRGRDFAIMLRSLTDLNYTVEWRVINAAEYGFPQRRKRVFIVAKAEEVFKDIYVDGRTMKRFFEEKSVLTRSFPISKGPDFEINTSHFELLGDLAELTTSFSPPKGKSPFLSCGVASGSKIWTVNVIPAQEPEQQLRSVLVPESQIPEKYFVPDEQLDAWRYLKGAKNIPRTHKESGISYFYSEGKMAFPDDLDKPARTILTAEGGSTPSRFKHIIQCESGRYRRLLPVELERLNGFPDGWTDVEISGKQVTDNRRAFFMGNALVVGLIERVGKTLADDWRELDQTISHR